MTYVPIIIGSPRKNGDTAVLAKEAERGLLANGITSKIYILNEMDIAGCQGCYGCKQDRNTSCTRLDDMQIFYQALTHADGIILASPIYFGGVTGQTKLWLDRLFPYIGFDLSSYLPKKIPLSVIYTQNQPESSLFTGAMNAFEYALSLIGFDIKNRLVAGNLDAGRKPGVSEYPQLMNDAFMLGKNLISS